MANDPLTGAVPIIVKTPLGDTDATPVSQFTYR
jgi:hypothetical protein